MECNLLSLYRNGSVPGTPVGTPRRRLRSGVGSTANSGEPQIQQKRPQWSTKCFHTLSQGNGRRLRRPQSPSRAATLYKSEVTSAALPSPKPRKTTNTCNTPTSWHGAAATKHSTKSHPGTRRTTPPLDVCSHGRPGENVFNIAVDRRVWSRVRLAFVVFALLGVAMRGPGRGGRESTSAVRSRWPEPAKQKSTPRWPEPAKQKMEEIRVTLRL